MAGAITQTNRDASCLLSMPRISVLSILLPTLLAVHGLSKKSLSTSGAITAFFVGFVMISGSLKLWGVSLIGFYLLGSRATKCMCRNLRFRSANHLAHSRWQTEKGKVGGGVSRLRQPVWMAGAQQLFQRGGRLLVLERSVRPERRPRVGFGCSDSWSTANSNRHPCIHE